MEAIGVAGVGWRVDRMGNRGRQETCEGPMLQVSVA